MDDDAAPHISGDDLIRAGIKPSRLFGKALAAVRAAAATPAATATPAAAATPAAMPAQATDTPAPRPPAPEAAGIPQHAGAQAAIARLLDVTNAPASAVDDPQFGAFARALVAEQAAEKAARERAFVERDKPARFANWCDDADPNAIAQMQHSMRLPSAVRGALMPDAHVGYGLPIGGVLATEGTVIPYAVGVDIACRMKLSVFDIAPAALAQLPERFATILRQETVFGIGPRGAARGKAAASAGGTTRRGLRLDHEVLDATRWADLRLLRELRDRAAVQLGTSGSGNHFVEFGVLALQHPDLGLPAGTYLAVMSHSGSRGPGAKIASYFSKRAQQLHTNVPRELAHLAWLDLDSDDGRAYWYAMNLMGEFASANHWVIHERIRRALGAEILTSVENHHNFAWLEEHDGRTLVVHRKGATPAGAGVLGVIPGSMASPAFVVRGRGETASLRSASHGAGRVMSRTAARQRFNWDEIQPQLRAANVTLLSAGIDENPNVYKDIRRVMARQRDLVDVIARFDPRIVRMADEGVPAED